MTTSSSFDPHSEGRRCAEHLDRCPRETLLSPRSDDTLISVTINDTGASQAVTKADYTNYVDFRRGLPTGNDRLSKSIIISLSSYGSNDPLRITKEDLQQLVIDENIDASFAEVIASFGELPRYSEQGFGCVASTAQRDGSYSVSYLLRFAESDGIDWRVRQVGVYQNFCTTSNSHLWILLQSHGPKEDTLSKQLDFMFRQEHFRVDLCRYPFSLHKVVLDTYLFEWRWYMRSLGKMYSSQSLNISTVRPERDPIFGLNMKTLQDCKKLVEDLIPLPAIFEATLGLITCLESIETKIRSTEDLPNFTRHRSILLDVKRSSEVLIGQTQGIVDLLGNTLDLKNQQDAAKVSSHLYQLSLRTSRDSATIMVITVVTMFYLPATFVATLFGMNFFDFNEQSHRIQLSQDIWIYAVMLIPLTGLTLLFGWRWRKRLMRSKDFGTSLEMKEMII